MLVSLLDEVPGLGDTRRKALMKRFGSLKRLRAASVEELREVPGIGRRTAEAVQAAIAEPAEPPAERRADDGAQDDGAQTVETTTAPQGPAERGTPTEGAGDTAEVGRVAS
jgi:excinuclease ABC subunit C